MWNNFIKNLKKNNCNAISWFSFVVSIMNGMIACNDQGIETYCGKDAATLLTTLAIKAFQPTVANFGCTLGK